MADGGQGAGEIALPRPKRSFGRSLSDFRMDGFTTPHGLHPAEEKLLECAARGELCSVGDEVPATPSNQNRIRPGLLRFLILSGDDEAPVHEWGVRLRGAYIEGNLDLAGARVREQIDLWRCRLDGDLIARNAQLNELLLKGSRLNSVICDSATISGNVHLSNGFRSRGDVSFFGAEIGGQVDCQDGKFENPGRVALNFHSAEIRGNVYLNGRFHAVGQVRFEAAQIYGHLNCQGAQIENPDGFALNGIDAEVLGSVQLSHNFAAFGAVIFRGAEIGGDFFCPGGKFTVSRVAPHLPHDAPSADAALNLQGALIRGHLFLGPARPPADRQVVMEGSLNLQSTHANAFVDSPGSWPAPAMKTETGGEAPSCIILDGFTYDRLAGGAEARSEIRQKWLLRQPGEHLGTSFRPQPFEQLIRVLREMGHDADARRIAMLKESLMRPSRTREARPLFRPFVWLTSWAWGLSCGYGYRPHRLFVLLLTLWLACSLLYKAGAEAGGFAPKDAQVWTNEAYKDCDRNWTTCEKGYGKLTEIIAFNPFTYSADMLLPVIDLGQRSAWTPMWREVSVRAPYLTSERRLTLPAGTLRAVAWAENILGVAGVILIGAILSGIIKRD